VSSRNDFASSRTDKLINRNNYCLLAAAGEVPNLFAKDELVSIMEAVTPRAKRAGKPLTPAGLWDYFLDSVRVNLHLVLTMSPVGGAFRERLRK
jgi:dynein heavy chain